MKFLYPIGQRILIYLYQNNQSPSSISKMSYKLYSTYSHILSILNEFEERELISITKKGRVNIVSLTQKGEVIAQKVNEIYYELGLKI